MVMHQFGKGLQVEIGKLLAGPIQGDILRGHVPAGVSQSHGNKWGYGANSTISNPPKS